MAITPVPSTAESERSPASLVPNTLAHSQTRTKYSGGVVSLTWTACNRAPNERCISCTVVASSTQKL